MHEMASIHNLIAANRYRLELMQPLVSAFEIALRSQPPPSGGYRMHLICCLHLIFAHCVGWGRRPDYQVTEETFVPAVVARLSRQTNVTAAHLLAAAHLVAGPDGARDTARTIKLLRLLTPTRSPRR